MFCTIFYTFRYSNRNIKINKKTRVSVEIEYQNYLPSNLKVGGESEREREREDPLPCPVFFVNKPTNLKDWIHFLFASFLKCPPQFQH